MRADRSRSRHRSCAASPAGESGRRSSMPALPAGRMRRPTISALRPWAITCEDPRSQSNRAGRAMPASRVFSIRVPTLWNSSAHSFFSSSLPKSPTHCCPPELFSGTPRQTWRPPSSSLRPSGNRRSLSPHRCPHRCMPRSRCLRWRWRSQGRPSAPPPFCKWAARSHRACPRRSHRGRRRRRRGRHRRSGPEPPMAAHRCRWRRRGRRQGMALRSSQRRLRHWRCRGRRPQQQRTRTSPAGKRPRRFQPGPTTNPAPSSARHFPSPTPLLLVCSQPCPSAAASDAKRCTEDLRPRPSTAQAPTALPRRMISPKMRPP
mmetsp:Transcript_110760/g.320032  ORF Transcript_110760/g.320032 Transcript_110760/m.320032 type:complete len:318 (-) Transcript_110760:75-1028(-)